MAKLEPVNDSGRASAAGDRVAAIRSEIADALGTTVDDPIVDTTYAELAWGQREIMEEARLADHQRVIDDALEFGRRLEETHTLGDTTINRFTEFLPGNLGLEDAVVRIGTETSEVDIFGNITTTKITNYFDPHGSLGDKLGTVFSVIEGGRETVTDVRENVLGSIELKPGDSRAVPPGGSSGAGLKPTSWDPKADGQYGTASGGWAGHSAGHESSSQTDHSNDQRSSSHDDGPSSPAGGGGSEGLHERPTPGDADDSSPTGDSSSSFVREQGGEQTATGSTTTHSDGTVTVQTQSETASGSVTYASEQERAETEVTQEPGTVSVEGDTTVEVEKPATTTDDDSTEYRANDGYSDPGPTPPPQGGTLTKASPAPSQYHAPKVSSATIQGNPIGGEQSNETNITGAPMDFGDSADPNQPDPLAVAEFTVPGTAEYDLVDADAIFTGGAGTIHAGFGGDYGDPTDPFASEAPTPENPNDTSPYEHDDFGG